MAWSLCSLPWLLASASVSSAFRATKSRAHGWGLQVANTSDLSSGGVVDKLYTWGAPATTDRKFLHNPKKQNGCWDGLRIANLKIGTITRIWDEDVVVGIAQRVGYWHTKQPTVMVDENGKVRNYPCGSTASNGFVLPSTKMHSPELYTARANVLNTEAKLMTKLCVLPSYRGYKEAAQTIRPYGWNLVGTAIWQSKETHLMQQPSTLECILTFQGTVKSRVLDWWDNLRFKSGRWCGLEDKVHGGFRNQLRAVVDNFEFQNLIKSQLPKCSGLTVAGHSLGGALATLFSVCVNAAPPGDADYKRIMWSKQTPTKLKPIA